jgi:glycosyltransferase involved in cell wall biosynthesis
MTMSPGLTVVLPTMGRPSLKQALQSVVHQDLQAGDEVIVVADGPQPQARAVFDRFHLPRVVEARFLIHGPTRDFGNQQRNFAYRWSHNNWVTHLDDDDIYCPDAFVKIRKALRQSKEKENHHHQPHVFKLKAPWGEIIPRNQAIKRGNVQTGCMVLNLVDRTNPPFVWPNYQGGDIDVLQDADTQCGPIVWRPEIIQIARPQSTDLWW